MDHRPLKCKQLQCISHDIEIAVQQYNSSLRLLLDKHPPMTGKTKTIHSKAEWFTDEIHKARRKRRQLE